jgi:hypothetical protein
MAFLDEAEIEMHARPWMVSAERGWVEGQSFAFNSRWPDVCLSLDAGQRSSPVRYVATTVITLEQERTRWPERFLPYLQQAKGGHQ